MHALDASKTQTLALIIGLAAVWNLSCAVCNYNLISHLLQKVHCAYQWFRSIFTLFLLAGFNLEANVMQFKDLSDIVTQSRQCTQEIALKTLIPTCQHVIARGQFYCWATSEHKLVLIIYPCT